MWSEVAPSCSGIMTKLINFCIHQQVIIIMPNFVILATCEDLIDPANGAVSIDNPSRVAGSSATYICNANFLLSGNSQRDCQTNGMWSGAAPVCSQGMYPWKEHSCNAIKLNKC